MTFLKHLLLPSFQTALLLLLPVFVALAQTADLPQGEYILSGISVEGAEHLSKRDVELLSGLVVGQKVNIPGDELGDAIKRLWRQGVFADIQLSAERVAGNKLFLKIAVKEQPVIARYTFKGVTKSQADDLRSQVGLQRRQQFTKAKEEYAVQKIKNYYHEKGFFNVEVEVTAEPDESMDNGLLIILKVKKGKKVKIKDIIITGNVALKDRKLRSKLKDTKKKKFWRIWKRSKFIPYTFEQDKEALVAYMNSEGYRDAEILGDSVVRVDRRNVNVIINLYEGKQYYFRNIEWKGNMKYRSGQLDTLLGIKKGDVYNTQLLEQRLYMDPGGNDISSLYMDDGYLFFRAEPVETNLVGDSVDLEIQIYEGPQAVYDKIIVQGNDKTSDYVILRQVRTLPGRKFSRSEIIRSQREILALGFFNQENFEVTPVPHPEKGTVDIKYVVEEKPSDQFFLQGGWGGRLEDSQGNQIGGGLILTVGLRFNNFSTRKFFKKEAWRPLPSGDGQMLSIQAQVNGVGFQNYGISFTEPWLGGRKPISLGVSANYSVQNSVWSDYRMAILGFGVDLGNRLKWPDDYFRSFSSVNYRYYDVRNAFNVFEGFNEGNINILSFRQTFNRTSVDVPIFPRRGSILDFSIEATPPWSLIRGDDFREATSEEKFRLLEFHKWKFRAESFTQLTNNKLPTVFYARAMFGFLGYYNGDIGLPPFERFYIGGDGLFGFNLDGREIWAFRGYSSPNINSDRGNPIANKFTFELRQPLSLNPGATVWLHAFGEAGNAYSNLDEYNPFALYRSFGGGIRIFLSMLGLLGVDYGYGLDQPPGVGAGGQFHFMIGQQF